MAFDLDTLHRLAFEAMPVLLDAAAKGLALLCIAGGLVLAMQIRKASAAAKQMVWLLALAALILLPLASAALPSWGVLPDWVRFEIAGPVGANTTATEGTESAENSEEINASSHLATSSANSMADAPNTAWTSQTPQGAPWVAPGERYSANPGNGGFSSDPSPGRGTLELENSTTAAVVAEPISPTATWHSWAVPLCVGLWLAGTMVCLTPLVLGRIGLWRVSRRSRRIAEVHLSRRSPEGEAGWGVLLRRAAESVGLRRTVTLLQSPHKTMPMVWGTLRPTLLLPAGADNWTIERRWIVLLHELAHAKRNDCLAKLVAHVACTFYWFNPLAWIAFKLMQREAEAACDDLVLSAPLPELRRASNSTAPAGADSSADSPTAGVAGVRPSDYAQHLLEIASGLKSGTLTAYSSIAMARKSKLEGRLLAILDATKNRRAMTRIGILAAAALITAIALPLAILKASGAEDAAVGMKDEKPPTTTQPANQPVANDVAVTTVPVRKVDADAVARNNRYVSYMDGLVPLSGEQKRAMRERLEALQAGEDEMNEELRLQFQQRWEENDKAFREAQASGDKAKLEAARKEFVALWHAAEEFEAKRYARHLGSVLTPEQRLALRTTMFVDQANSQAYPGTLDTKQIEQFKAAIDDILQDETFWPLIHPHGDRAMSVGVGERYHQRIVEAVQPLLTEEQKEQVAWQNVRNEARTDLWVARWTAKQERELNAALDELKKSGVPAKEAARRLREKNLRLLTSAQKDEVLKEMLVRYDKNDAFTPGAKLTDAQEKELKAVYEIIAKADAAEEAGEPVETTLEDTIKLFNTFVRTLSAEQKDTMLHALAMRESAARAELYDEFISRIDKAATLSDEQKKAMQDIFKAGDKQQAQHNQRERELVQALLDAEASGDKDAMKAAENNLFMYAPHTPEITFARERYARLMAVLTAEQRLAWQKALWVGQFTGLVEPATLDDGQIEKIKAVFDEHLKDKTYNHLLFVTRSGIGEGADAAPYWNLLAETWQSVMTEEQKEQRQARKNAQILAGVVGPYNAAAQKISFIKAANGAGELDAKAFEAARGENDSDLVRPFEKWETAIAFDKNKNGTLDWSEFNAYRQAMRKAVLAACDRNKDGQLTGDERIAAGKLLAEGKLTIKPGAAPAAKPAPTTATAPALTTTPAVDDSRPSLKELQARTEERRRPLFHVNARLRELDNRIMEGDATAAVKEEHDALAKVKAEAEKEFEAAWQDEENERIRRFDKDGDGKLSEAERLAMHRELRWEDAPKFARNFLLRHCDANGDGLLDDAEWNVFEDFCEDWREAEENWLTCLYGGSEDADDEETRKAMDTRYAAAFANVEKASWKFADPDNDGSGPPSAEKMRAMQEKMEIGHLWYMIRYEKQALAATGGKPGTAALAAILQAFDEDMRQRIEKATIDDNGFLAPQDLEKILLDVYDEALKVAELDVAGTVR